jgi:hypothetical protein
MSSKDMCQYALTYPNDDKIAPKDQLNVKKCNSEPSLLQPSLTPKRKCLQIKIGTSGLQPEKIKETK